MVFICSNNARIARLLAERLDGDRRLFLALPHMLRALALHQPVAVLVHARVGGNIARAVEFVPAMRRLAPRAGIIIATHAPTAGEIAEAIRWGVYGYVNVESRECAERVREIVTVLRQREPDRNPSASGGPSSPLH